MADFDDEGTLAIKAIRDAPPDQPDEGEACIILLYPPGPEIGRRVSLSRNDYAIGRAADNDVVVDRDSVSRHHARLFRGERRAWFVEDLGSTNGTIVNDRRVHREELRDGDQLHIGDTIYKFLSGSNVEAAYHEEIYRMTILDGLTEMYNRRYFLDFLEREIASALRHGHPLTLVMFDIDHFKRVNDQRGHLAGDMVLKELSARLRPRMRREDLLARYGGEEFAAILTCTDLAGGVAFAEHIRARIADKPFEHDGEEFAVTISLGVACMANEPKLSTAELIQRADERLYAAKDAGRNCVVS